MIRIFYLFVESDRFLRGGYFEILSAYIHFRLIIQQVINRLFITIREQLQVNPIIQRGLSALPIVDLHVVFTEYVIGSPNVDNYASAYDKQSIDEDKRRR